MCVSLVAAGDGGDDEDGGHDLLHGRKHDAVRCGLGAEALERRPRRRVEAARVAVLAWRGRVLELPTGVVHVADWPRHRVGHTDESAHAGRYVNDTPLDENCCPFIDTSTRRRPDDDDDDAAHSATPQPTTRAAAVATLDSKRQRIVADSRKPIDGPSTDTRVPPATGPDGGTSALTCSAPCT